MKRNPLISSQADKPPYSVVCSFCNEGFSVGVPIIGETNEKKIAQFGGRLSKHMMQQHPEQAQAIAQNIQALVSNFVGYLSFSGYAIHDTEMLSQLTQARRIVKHAVMGPVPTDETLKLQADSCRSYMAKLPPSSSFADCVEMIADLLKELRDVMQEKVTEPVQEGAVKL